MASQLDIQANRRAVKYGPRELLGRVCWAAAGMAFRWSPRPCWGWRRFLLRLFGAEVGREVRIHPTARILFPWNLRVGDWSAVSDRVFIYNLGMVTLGERVTISHGAELCAGTHDDGDPAMRLLKRPIQIGDDAWIAAGAFVGPGVNVGEGALLGARAVAMRDVEPWTVMAGNPAKFLRKRELRKRA